MASVARPNQQIKKQVRVLGIDDSPFDKFNPLEKKVLVIGTVYRGGDYMDGVLSTHVEKDGIDATLKIAEMINTSKFKPQLQTVFLNGISVGGFNVINLPKLHEMTCIPVIGVVRDYPNFEKFFAAMEKLGMQEKMLWVHTLPKPARVGKVYIQPVGISLAKATELLKTCSTHAEVPECLRIAHLIASGIVTGESKGRA